MPFVGVCLECTEPIPKGSDAVHISGKGLHHPGCVPPPLVGVALTPADIAYLKELAGRIRHVPIKYGVDGDDSDRLLSIASGNSYEELYALVDAEGN